MGDICLNGVKVQAAICEICEDTDQTSTCTE